MKNWENILIKGFVVGAVLTDLSKAFDCIPHDLLIAKLEAYGLGEKALSFIFSYLTNQNQGVLVNDKRSDFQKIISGVLQGSIAGPILFNFSINDVLLCFKCIIVQLCWWQFFICRCKDCYRIIKHLTVWARSYYKLPYLLKWEPGALI